MPTIPDLPDRDAPDAEPAAPGTEPCQACLKPPELCVCAEIRMLDHRIEVVILQHPQEQDRALGTARLTTLQLERGRLRVGLSWPNLAKAIDRPGADPRHWAVLFLGPQKGEGATAPLAILDRQGTALAPQAADRLAGELHGLILLDGSWSQAKTLWWRNPWLLKCWRIVLDTGRPSLYGSARKEPRRDSISTLEAAAFALARLEHRPELETAMLAPFEVLLQRYRAAQATGKPQEHARPRRSRPGAGHRRGGSKRGAA